MKASFSARRELQFKKSKPKSDKVLQQQKKLHFFLSKINKVRISEANFTKSERKVCFEQFFVENSPFDEPKKMPSSKRLYVF